MKIIRNIFVITFFVFLFNPLSVFAEHDFNNGMLDSSYEFEYNNLPDEIIDNDLSTFYEVIGNVPSFELIFNEPSYIDSFYINLDLTNSVLTDKKLNILFSEGTGTPGNLVFEARESGYYEINKPNVKSISLFNSNGNIIYEFDVFGEFGVPIDEVEDTTPPENIKNLTHSVTSNSVSFSYDLPIDDDFSHLKVYRDNELIINNHTINTFTDTGLDDESEYSYLFKSVDLTGNISEGITVGIITNEINDITPPLAPDGLTGTIGNSSLILKWNDNIENDLAGYNIYVNDIKYNNSLIPNSFYTLTNLNNDQEYNISITAADTSNNESEHSLIKSFIPLETGMPYFDMGYTLTDVAVSTEYWFSELWLILAFAVAIPLSFYIANRVKGLFLT